MSAHRRVLSARLKTSATVVGTGTGVGALATPAAAASGDPWAAVRQCESGGTYSINNGNGFYGAYQFTLRTWRGRRQLAAGATIAALAVGLGACTSSAPSPTSAPATSKVDQPLSATASHPDSFTIAASGDLLIHQAVAKRAQAYGTASGHAYDFSPMLAKVRPLLSSADLAICHVETPMSPDDADVSVYSVPHELADAIHTAGYEGCSTASNHAIDRGTKGVTATLNALDRAGVAHGGDRPRRRRGDPPGDGLTLTTLSEDAM